MEKKEKFIRLKYLLLFFVVVSIVICANPLRRSDETIMKNILKDTPIGTKVEDVMEHIENKKKWEVSNIVYNQPIDGTEIETIRVSLGDYLMLWGIGTTNVTVFYYFNEKSELNNVRVWKTNDSF